MKQWIACAAGLSMVVAGCTTKSTANARAQAAYLEGQRQAAAAAQPSPALQLPMVYITGPVRYPTIPWTAELTLARALAAADYLNPGDPSQIFVVRNGEMIPVLPHKLLQGQDMLLFPGDRIDVRP